MGSTNLATDIVFNISTTSLYNDLDLSTSLASNLTTNCSSNDSALLGYVPELTLFPDWDNVVCLPIEMRFNAGHVVSLVFNSVMIVFSSIANLTVLSIILRRRRTSGSRINTMLMHLAIADLMVTFLLMPVEIVWAATVSWRFGDAACRITAFFRSFGLYLSSFVLICISIDRYFAVLKPMNLSDVDRRGKVMLNMAWVGSTICSIPQMFVFHVERHPDYKWYEQCITFNTFTSRHLEIIYVFFGSFMLYGLPLLVIIFSYVSILAEIYRRSVEDKFRRSSLGFLSRAKSRTLKMTITIVVVFIICWTPYHVMCIWYWLNPVSALKVDQRVSKGLYLFACTNSCMNPVVYGAFNIRTRRRPQQPHDRMISRQEGMDVLRLVSWRRSASTPAAGKRHYCRACHRGTDCLLVLEPVKRMTHQSEGGSVL